MVPPNPAATGLGHLHRPNDGLPLRHGRDGRAAAAAHLRQEGHEQAHALRGGPLRRPSSAQDTAQGGRHQRPQVPLPLGRSYEAAPRPQDAEVPRGPTAVGARQAEPAPDGAERLPRVDHPRGHGAAQGDTVVPGAAAELVRGVARPHRQLGLRRRLREHRVHHVPVGQTVPHQVRDGADATRGGQAADIRQRAAQEEEGGTGRQRVAEVRAQVEQADAHVAAVHAGQQFDVLAGAGRKVRRAEDHHQQEDGAGQGADVDRPQEQQAHERAERVRHRHRSSHFARRGRRTQSRKVLIYPLN